MSREILINITPMETRVAVVENGAFFAVAKLGSAVESIQVALVRGIHSKWNQLHPA